MKIINKIKKQIKFLLLPAINYEQLFTEHQVSYDIKKINDYLFNNKMLLITLAQIEKLHESERAILYAVFSQNLPLVKSLIIKKVNINFANQYILRQIMKNYISLNNWELTKYCMEQTNNIYPYLEEMLTLTLKFKDEQFFIELVKKCLNKERSKKESITSKVLKNSIEHRNFNVFQQLVHIVDNKIVEKNYKFILKYALFFNNNDIINEILKRKKKIKSNEIEEKAQTLIISPLGGFNEDFFENVPLVFVSAQYNSLEIFKKIELLNPIEKEDKERIMIWASLNNNEEILNYLKNNGYSLIAKEYFGSLKGDIKLSPFMIAAKKDKLNILEYLIKNNALDTNALDDDEVKKETKDYIRKYNDTYLLAQNMNETLTNNNKVTKRTKL